MSVYGARGRYTFKLPSPDGSANLTRSGPPLLTLVIAGTPTATDFLNIVPMTMGSVFRF